MREDEKKGGSRFAEICRRVEREGGKTDM